MRLGQVGKLQKLGKIAKEGLEHNAGKVKSLNRINKKIGPKVTVAGTGVKEAADVIGSAPRYKRSLNNAGSSLARTGERIGQADKIAEFNVPKAVSKSVGKTVKAGGNLAGMMFKESDKNLLGVGLSTPGKIVVGAAALTSGTKEAATQFNNSTRGRQDTQTSSFAPRVPSYAQNGGATGDLVFALNANRKG